MKKTAIVVLVALTCLACGTSDSSSNVNGGDIAASTNPQGEVELCSLAAETLPGSVDTPATNEELAESLTRRAELMLQIAESSTGDLADALTMSSDAMSRLADSVANNADPAALDGLLSSLTEDTKFIAAQVTIDDAVNSACGEEQ
jgi:hypothetical protein